MTDDVAEMWWSNTSQASYVDYYQNWGTYCYVDHGARREIDGFPSGDTFFQGPCDSGAG